MAYCVAEDIVLRQPEIDLVKLTDDDGLGQVNAGVLEGAIADADAVIDGHLRGRLEVPISPVPDLLRRLSVDLTLHFLHQRRGLDTYKQRYEDARELLKEIRAGSLVLGEFPEGEKSRFFVSNKTAGDRVFTRDVLDRMP